MSKKSFLEGLARCTLAQNRTAYYSRIQERLNERLAQRTRDNARRAARYEKGQRLVRDIAIEMKLERAFPGTVVTVIPML